MADQGQNQGGNPPNPAQQQPSQQFIKPEQITAQNFPMFNADVLGKYRNGFTQLYSAMNSHPVGSDMHTQALNKLREANSKLVTQLRIHKQQRGQQGSPQQQQQQQQQQQGQPQQAYQNQVAQQQAAQQQAAQQQGAQQQAAQQLAAQQQAQQQRAQQAQQQQANQQAPQRPNSQGQPQIPQQQQQNMPSANSLKAPDELPPDIKAKVEKANLAHPQGMQPAGLEKWYAEALKRYGDALYQKRVARLGIVQCDRLIAQAQAQNEEPRPDVVAKKKDFQKTIADSDSFIQRLSSLQTQAGHQTTIWDEEENGSASNLNGGGEGQQARPASSQAASSGAPGPGTASTANSQQQQQLLLQQQQARQGQGPNAPSLPMQQNQASQPNQQQNFNARQPQNPAQGASAAQNQSRPPSQPVGAGGPNGEPPVPLSHQEAIARASKTWTGGQGQQQQQQSQQNPQQQQAQQPQQTGATASNLGQMPNATDVDKKPDKAMPINKNFNPTTPQPVSVPAPRPTLAGSNNGPLGMMGQPAIQKPEPYLLQGPGDRVLDKKKLDELVRQVTGGGGADGETLHPEVEESILQLADEFIENVVSSACRLAKLRGSASLEVRDIQLILERQYNIRIPGYSTDEVRTVRKIQPAAGYLQKMNAVQAAKVMNGRTDI